MEIYNEGNRSHLQSDARWKMEGRNDLRFAGADTRAPAGTAPSFPLWRQVSGLRESASCNPRTVQNDKVRLGLLGFGTNPEELLSRSFRDGEHQLRFRYYKHGLRQ
jgi:hypothetical protein